MEHLGLWLYLASLIDNICGVCQIGVIFSFVYIFLKNMFLVMENGSVYDNENKLIFKFPKAVIIAGAFLTIVLIAIPTSSIIYLILGVNAGKEVITNDTGKKAIELLNLMLDKQINDIKGVK